MSVKNIRKTIYLSKEGNKLLIKLADNFAGGNQSEYLDRLLRSANMGDEGGLTKVH